MIHNFHNEGRPPAANKVSPFPFPHYEVVAVVTHGNSYDKKTGLPLMSYSARLHEVVLHAEGENTVTRHIAWLDKENMQFAKSSLHSINYGPAGGMAIDTPKGKEPTHIKLGPSPRKDPLFKHPLSLSILYLSDKQAYDKGYAYHLEIHHTLLPQRVVFVGNYPALNDKGWWRWAWQTEHRVVIRGGK